MRTAVDTNVLIDLLGGDQSTSFHARAALEAAHARGAIVLCPVVIAELIAYPDRGEADVEALVSAIRATVDWTLASSIWREAGRAFAEYAVRRRRSAASHPRRLLADFVIGAHAASVGRLLTRDLGLYRASFPQLELAPWLD